MNVKPGYKQTEVGVIPEDWEPVTIGEVAVRVGSGITPRGGNSNYREYGRPFVRSQNVGWGRLVLEDLVFITDEVHRTFAATELQENDVLLNITGASIGRSALANRYLVGGNVNQHVCIIRTDERIAPKFLNALLLSDLGQRQIDSFQAGGNREGLNFGQIRSMKFPLPPTRAEQEAIAGALSDADALIESLEQLVAKKRQIKHGTMQQLLTGQKRLPGFTDPWETKRLGEVVDADPENLGADTRPDYAFNYISLEDVDCGTLRSYTEQLFRSAPSRARRKLRKNDVLVSTVRPNLLSHLLFTLDGERWVCSTGFCVVRCRSGITHPYFVFSHLFGDGVKRQIETLLTGSNYPAINSGDVKALQIPLPEYDEQSAIAAILSDMDAEIAALEAKLAKARQVKQGMMQELLTGRTRLI